MSSVSNKLRRLTKQNKIFTVLDLLESSTKSDLNDQKTVREIEDFYASLQSRIKELIFELQNDFSDKNYPLLFKKLNLLPKNIQDDPRILAIKGYAEFNTHQYEQAHKTFESGVKLHVDQADLHLGLANSLHRLRDTQQALRFYKEAFNCSENKKLVLKDFSVALTKSVDALTLDEYAEFLIFKLLSSQGLYRTSSISKPLSKMIFESLLQFKFTQISSRQDFQSNIETILYTLSRQQLLVKFLHTCVVSDPSLELFLTEVRRAILTSSYGTSNKKVLSFLSALAHQCYMNEYAFYESEEEKLKLQKINENSSELSAQHLAIILLYKAPSDELTFINRHYPALGRELTNRNIENELKNSIKTLSPLSDQVSSIVRQQYEDNPYPKWAKMNIPHPIHNFRDYLIERNVRIKDPVKISPQSQNILVAGCGTGQHLLNVAFAHPKSKIFALDLSVSSLAYAMRMSHELGASNIEFFQGDILDVNELNIEFDLIECIGVLHHMDNPKAGLHALLSCLKDHGLIKLGLYSQRARKQITLLRSQFVSQIENYDEDFARGLRRKILLNQQSEIDMIRSSTDFYDLSSFRDLLLHSQEHTYSVTQLEDLLIETGLYFCGFSNQELVSIFINKFATRNDIYDLSAWNKFEEKYPLAFANMYQFWSQK